MTCECSAKARRFWSFKDIRHSQGERGWIEIGPVAEHDQRKIFPREPLDDRAKSLRGAEVPHARAAFVRIEKPSESVGNRFARIQIVVAGLRWPARR